jgi:uncharacterized membrane protein
MFTPDEIKGSINIQATSRQVFDVIMAFDRYPEWNPWMHRVWKSKNNDQDFFAVHSTIGPVKHHMTSVIEAERVCWNLCGWHRFFVQAQREILLYPALDNRTLVTMKVTLSGPALLLVKLFLKSTIRKALMAELKALKHHSEMHR